MRGLVKGSPFERTPKLMLKRLVEVDTRNLNPLSAENRISDALIPITIVARGNTPDERAFSLYFGAVVETVEDNGWLQNSNRTRSTLAVVLGPSPHRKPSHISMSLFTGRRLRQEKWTEMSTLQWFTDHVHFMGEMHVQKWIPGGVMTVHSSKT